MFAKDATSTETGMTPHTIVFQVNASILMRRKFGVSGNAGHVRPGEGFNIPSTHGYLVNAGGPFHLHQSLPPVPQVAKEQAVIHETPAE